MNQKGGVGKSTTAVNLGAALAVRGQRVLVVDSDPQGNTTTGFGIDKSRIEHDIYDVLMQQATIADVRQPSEIEGLDVVPATINLAGAEIELVSGLSRETRMRSALAPIADTYDYTLIDCPPSLGLLTINALTAAREIIIPVQAEYYALEGLSQLTNVVRRVREALNPTLYFPQQIFKTQIPRNIRLSEAPSFGKPVILFDIKSRGAQAYISLAKEMLDAMAVAAASAG